LAPSGFSLVIPLAWSIYHNKTIVFDRVKNEVSASNSASQISAKPYYSLVGDLLLNYLVKKNL